MTNVNFDDIRVLTAAETAELMTISIPVLDRWRKEEIGPRFIRLGARRVGYRVGDLKVWMAARVEGGASNPHCPT